MSRYWVIAPFAATSPDEFRDVWEHDLQQGIISIGWKDVGPIEGRSIEDVNAIVRDIYPSYFEAQATRVANMLWQFHNEVSPGDIVVARRGRSAIAAIGTVREPARFVPDGSMRAPGVDYNHNRVLPVEWQSEHRDIVFPAMAFGMHTIYEIDNEKYRALIQGEPIATTETEEPAASESATEFALERYLEDFIVTNFASIFSDSLVLYEDPVEGVIGQQFNTDVGVIDILAQDPSSGDFVVIELKKGRAADRVVGQTLRYMGWVQENLASGGQAVRGIIICRDPDVRLSYAVKIVPTISIKTYRVSFALKDDA